MESIEEDRERTLSNLQIFGFLWRQWMRRPVAFAGLVAFSVLATITDILLPIAAGALVETVAADPSEQGGQAWRNFWFFTVIATLFMVFRQIAVRCEIPMSVWNMQEMTAQSFEKVQRFSSDWHANSFAGSTVRKISRGMWAYDVITATLFLGLGPTLLVLLGLSTYMLFTWPMIGLYAICVLSLFVVLTVLASVKYIQPANRVSNACDSDIGGALADAIGGNAVIKSFGAEEREDGRFLEVMARWRKATHKTWNRFVNAWFILQVSILSLQTGVLFMLLMLWRDGQASPGDLAFALTAFLLMAGYMRRFGEEIQQLQRGIDEIEDMAVFERQQSDIADEASAVAFQPGSGAIRFEAVGFSYENQSHRLYENFDLDIQPGERVALVGPTGAGKSTFVKLVQRLYDVQEGRVLIDGQDVRRVTQSSLRAALALVPQDPVLFHRSIAENIAYGRPEATRAEVEAAAKRARAHDFIEGLPKGYETLVGERGVKLSGGERQRVAIARALLADAPILILDEATSSLDTRTEQLVQAAMETLMEGRTTIIIAHRLSTVRSADRILVFDQGRIVEQGTHQALVALGGTYAELHAVAEAAA